MATKNSAGGFKQMPKMMTTEPSVILKMKKGGHVNMKQDAKGENGHSPMTTAKHRESMEAEEGNSPKKPSMSERKKAMNPNFKDGGKVAKMADGGMMGGMMGRAPMRASPAMGAMANPAMRAAMAKRAMAQRAMAQQAMAQRAMAGAPAGGALQPGMKKGGEVAKLEKELKQHESMKASKAHKGLKSGGVAGYVNTKMHDGDKTDRTSGTGKVKMGNAGGYAAGGTITGNAKQYENTKMVDGDRNNPATGTKGVRMGNAGGYAMGGNVNWENRPANTSKPGKVNTTTGEVKKANAGGYKDGGMTMVKKNGKMVPDFAADGKGKMKDGGMMMGGQTSKKAYATGGSVNDQGKAVKMPAHFVSRPVANSLQSGTFKKGGQVKKYEDGGSTGNDKYTVKDPKAVSDKASRELEDALNPLSMAKELYGKAKSYFSPTIPAGSVTKTEKSVTVAPGKKRGGSAC